MRKSIYKITMALAGATVLTACSISGQTEIAEVSDDMIKGELLEYLNKKDYAVDEIYEFSKEVGTFTEEEGKEISSQFTGKTTIRKYVCNFKTRSVERDIDGQCEAVYAYFNNAWTLVKIQEANLENWSFQAKSEVSVRQIRDDLAAIEFATLPNVKIGNESDTQIEIVSRKSDIENGNDNVDIVVTYNADFAVYKIGIKLMYKHEHGEWVLSSHAIDDVDFWEIEFDDNMKPNKPKEEYIINSLSNSSNYKNYMMNLSYVDNYYVTEEKETVVGNTVNYNYVVIVSYDEIGDIEYNVTKPYSWIDKAWQEQELTVDVKKADFEKFLGTWASTNGDFVRFTNAENNILTGTYTHKYEDGNYVSYDVKGTVNVELTDNNWALMIEQKGIAAGEEEEHFVILPFQIDFEKTVIKSNGNIYIAKGDEEGGPGFTLNEDGSYFEEKDDDEEIEKDPDYSSGLDFFGSDSYREESGQTEE